MCSSDLGRSLCHFQQNANVVAQDGHEILENGACICGPTPSCRETRRARCGEARVHLRKETCEQVDFLYGISAELGQARQILGCSVHSFAPFVYLDEQRGES